MNAKSVTFKFNTTEIPSGSLGLDDWETAIKTTTINNPRKDRQREEDRLRSHKEGANFAKVYTLWPRSPSFVSQTDEIQGLLESFFPGDKSKVETVSAEPFGVLWWKVSLTFEQYEIVRDNILVS